MTAPAPRLVRAPAARVMSGRGSVWLLEAGGSGACHLGGPSGEVVLAALDAARGPSSPDALVAAVAESAGVDLSERRAIDEAVALLVRTGALVDADAAPLAPAAGVTGRVLVAVTGAIAAAYAVALVQRLLVAGHEVRVVMTRAARRFATARTFEALTHQPVVTGMWRGSPGDPAPHVELARWADVVVVYPCSATTASRLAAGDCSDIVSATATTTRAPVLLAPSMNVEMLEAPSVASNLERLRERGFFVAHPGSGVEVADAPAERSRHAGAAAPVEDVARYVAVLLERAAAGGPRLPTRAEWDSDHRRRAEHAGQTGSLGALDGDLAQALRRHAAEPSRVLELGTGSGDVARALARLGHAVVATDFSREAVARAQARDPSCPVTWVVDDATASDIRGSFDLCIDRACLGCIPASRRERYVAEVAERVRPGGVWLLKVHQAPTVDLRAHGFSEADIRALTAPWFDVIAVHEATLRFEEGTYQPAWTFELQRRA